MRKRSGFGRTFVGEAVGALAIVLLLRVSVTPAAGGQTEQLSATGRANWLDPIPPGGDCSRTGWKYRANPFSGWPLEQHACELVVVPWGYCDERHPTEIPHWGVDIAYPGIEGANVISTTDRAIVGRMHDEGRWNGGMGNYVELRALECRQERMRNRCQDGACESILEPLPRLDISGGVWRLELVELCHETGWYATYMHLEEVSVAVGERVKRGQVVGRVGAVGNASGFHLHYEITSLIGAVDPMPTMCEVWIEY